MHDEETTNNLAIAIVVGGAFHFTSEAVERADELLIAALAEAEVEE